ncbi:MAG: cadmium-translocating P-type ATPase [Anaerolinea sp.]|nr:cadmium-translocating P-type ATPase [Anaerolinea sp.]MCC6973211.1 cadmium-translocating P-type ATPase [Anaerolineae bacterium]
MSTQTYTIGGMDCAHCAQEVESGVEKLQGVNSVRVEFATCKMILDGDVSFETLKQRVESLGKTVTPYQEQAAGAVSSRGGLIGFWDYLLARRETRLALIGGGIVMITAILGLLLRLPESTMGIAYSAGMLITLYPILKSGINSLRINREFNINLLMSIAAVGAILIGEYLESATVIFLFAVGESLEGYTADRARNSIRSLIALKPRTALRLRNRHEEQISVDDLAVGEIILVKPGENIPMDGVVRMGASGVNQAPITGESVPIAKTPGAEVFAGSINGEGTLQIEVTRLAQDNTLSRIIKLVEEAQNVRAPSQRLIDQFARYYTPAVTVLAALVAFLPPLLFGAPFYDTAAGHGWLYRALSMLVIACPCALVISAPVTVISAITAAARRGILIKGGAHLEALGMARAFAFDKTGTLTQGKPTVTGYRAADCTTEDGCERCDEILALATAVERRAAHPLAQAVVSAAESRHLEGVYAPAESVEMLAGRGVRGRVEGKEITVGSHPLFDQEHPHPVTLCRDVQAAEAQGQTTMMLAEGGEVKGFIALADTLRADSPQVIHDLNAMNIATVMLTGDNLTAAKAIGAQAGVRDVRAGLLPADKVEAVKELLKQHGNVVMVGDGINDTPALAAATVGIAMGGAGSPQALETADVALMADDLGALPYAVRLSRFARGLIRQNVGFSFTLKAGFLVLALLGATSLWAAVFADVGMSLMVTLNGMRPLSYKG